MIFQNSHEEIIQTKYWIFNCLVIIQNNIVQKYIQLRDERRSLPPVQ